MDPRYAPQGEIDIDVSTERVETLVLNPVGGILDPTITFDVQGSTGRCYDLSKSWISPRVRTVHGQDDHIRQAPAEGLGMLLFSSQDVQLTSIPVSDPGSSPGLAPYTTFQRAARTAPSSSVQGSAPKVLMHRDNYIDVLAASP